MKTREFEIKPDMEKTLVKLAKKDKPLYEAVMKKINEVVNSGDGQKNYDFWVHNSAAAECAIANRDAPDCAFSIR